MDENAAWIVIQLLEHHAVVRVAGRVVPMWHCVGTCVAVQIKAQLRISAVLIVPQEDVSCGGTMLGQQILQVSRKGGDFLGEVLLIRINVGAERGAEGCELDKLWDG